MENRYELLSGAISCMYHDIQKIERVEMARYGLKGPHAQCLLAIKKHPEGITAARLCEVCEKDKAAVSRTLAELEEVGMIYRENRNGSRYRSALMLTEQGEIAAEAVVEKARMAVERAGIGFGEAEREVFYRVLAIIAGNLHKLCKEGLTRNHESCV
ncbi:MAG: winged helix-turn-helix transcriptional regulator [Oscillospiraceae bacterium]|nr:winged helix-turn-helix transcriptional regulator [Oscillospiraceae bacterium]